MGQLEAIMSDNVIHINHKDHLEFVINLFERAGISGAPVMGDEGSPVGVLSKTDLVSSNLVELIKSGKAFSEITAADVMNNQEPISVDITASLLEALTLMQREKIHRVFVQDEKKRFVGIVSAFDIVKIIRKREDTPRDQANYRMITNGKHQQPKENGIGHLT